MASEMVERVARAIWARQLEHGLWSGAATGVPYDELWPSGRDHLAGIARAAIEAMGEPTDAMINEALK